MNTPPVSDLPTYDVHFNSTSLKYSHCRRRYHLAVVKGYVDNETAEALTFGKAVHKYAERRSLGDDHIQAFTQACAIYQGKELAQLSGTCSTMPIQTLPAYCDSDGHIYAEHQFKVYWKSIVYNGCQFNIWVMGTFDLITLFSNGMLRINDYKTSRKWKANEVFADYAVSVQMRFYIWVAYKFAHHIFDITAANAAQRNNLWMQITAIFVGKTPVIWQAGSPLQFTIEQLNEFEDLLNHYLATDILPSWFEAEAHPTGMANNTCAKCPFQEYCHSATESGKIAALTRHRQVKYDPSLW